VFIGLSYLKIARPYRQTDGWMDGWTGGYRYMKDIYRCRNGWMDGWMDRFLDRII